MTQQNHDIFDELAENENGDISKAQIEQLSNMAAVQKELEGKEDEVLAKKIFEFAKNHSASLATLEAAVKMRKGELNRIRNDLLPDYMDEIGMAAFELSDGSKIEIKKGLSVSVKDKDKLYNWFTKKGWKALIKSRVEIVFPEGTPKIFLKDLDKKKYTYSAEDKIHPQTLKAHVKREMEKGTNFPSSIIDIFEYRYTKLT